MDSIKNDLIWTTGIRKISELIPYDHNPRKMSKEQARQLMASLQKFNYVELVAVNLDGSILAGHMRIAAMKKLGWGNDSIEVRIPSRMLHPDECTEYLIRSNKNHGEWDWDILAQDYNPKDLHEWGFTSEELADGVLDLKVEDLDDDDRKCETCPSCGQKIKVKING